MTSVTVDVDNRKEIGSRHDFELQRSEKDAWKPVSWARLKRAAQEETGTRRPHVNLVLRAAKGNEWLGREQDFGLDSTGALRAAKLLIRDGRADSVWVDARYSRVFSERGPTSHTLFHLRRGTQSNPAGIPSGTRTLTRSEVLKVSKALKAIGSKLPRMGYCIRLPDGREVCRDRRGLYLIGHKKNPPMRPAPEKLRLARKRMDAMGKQVFSQKDFDKASRGDAQVRRWLESEYLEFIPHAANPRGRKATKKKRSKKKAKRKRNTISVRKLVNQAMK